MFQCQPSRKSIPEFALLSMARRGRQTAGLRMLYLLSVPKAATPSNPILLNLLSTYLLRALHHTNLNFTFLASRLLPSPVKAPRLSAFTKCCNFSAASTKPPPKPKSANLPPSPEAIFGLRMCALRCLAHTSASSPKQHILRPGHQIYEYPRQNNTLSIVIDGRGENPRACSSCLRRACSNCRSAI